MKFVIFGKQLNLIIAILSLGAQLSMTAGALSQASKRAGTSTYRAGQRGAAAAAATRTMWQKGYSTGGSAFDTGVTQTSSPFATPIGGRGAQAGRPVWQARAFSSQPEKALTRQDIEQMIAGKKSWMGWMSQKVAGEPEGLRLGGKNLSGLDLRNLNFPPGTSFLYANLSNADLTGSTFPNANFMDANLFGTKGLVIPEYIQRRAIPVSASTSKMDREYALMILSIPRDAANLTEADLKLALNNTLFNLAGSYGFEDRIAQAKEAYQVLISPPSATQKEDVIRKYIPNFGFVYSNELPKSSRYHVSGIEALIKERPGAFRALGLAQGASKQEFDQKYKALFQNIDANDPQALEKLKNLWKNYALITGSGLEIGLGFDETDAQLREYRKIIKDQDKYRLPQKEHLKPAVEGVD